MGNKSSKCSHEGGTSRKDFSLVSTLRKSSRSLRRKSLVPRSHLSIRLWLEQLDLTQYEDNLKIYAGVEDLLYVDENRIKDLGIVMSSHRARIMTSLYCLKAKYEKNNKLKLDLNPRSSLVEGEQKELIVKLKDDTQVFLRDSSICCRRSAEKRVGALISPDTIVKMSFGGDPPPHQSHIDEAELKKLLEWELSLDSSDLRAHAWYHGAIPRGHAEQIIKQNGQFLIRDCISQPGDYVLSCCTQSQVLHFVIQKTMVQPETVYERFEYQLEGDAFDTIPDLITSYVGGRKAVTSSSGARINIPVNRNAPLSFYVSTYMPATERPTVLNLKEPQSVAPTLRKEPMRVRRPSSEINPDGTNHDAKSRSIQFSSQSLPRKVTDLCLTSTNEAPPKPSRKTSTKHRRSASQQSRVYQEIDEDPPEDPKTPTRDKPMVTDPRHSRVSDVYQSGSDSGNGSGESVQTTSSDNRNRNSQASFEDSAYNIQDSLAEEPDLDPPSAIDLDNFSTLLLPAVENRPLDPTALRGVRNILMESGSRVLAAHLTRVDLDLLNGSFEQHLGVTSGLELITLPQGSQLRKDLIERTECLKLLVALTIVKEEEVNARAEMISKWIQVAIDTKTSMGNLFAFTAIMLGLCMPEIQRLTHTWHTVRQKYTDSAFRFEAKLRSTLKSMNEGSSPQAPNTVIPHLLPFLLLCERDLEDIYALHNKGDSLLQWESCGSDHGLQLLLSHLQEGRQFGSQLPLYKRNAQYILTDMSVMEELTLDVFKVEFHLKFLFGSRAAFADSHDRVPMFQRVISTMSMHCQPS